MISRPRSHDPWLHEVWAILNEELNLKEPMLMGYRHDGVNLHLQFRAAYGCPWTQVHVQSTGEKTVAAGEIGSVWADGSWESGSWEDGSWANTDYGGATYNPLLYLSSTEVDCRANRTQSVQVVDVPEERHVVFLIPVQKDGAGTKTLYNGVDGEDRMAFQTLGL